MSGGTLLLALPLGLHPLRVPPDRWSTLLEQHAQKFKRNNCKYKCRDLLRDAPT